MNAEEKGFLAAIKKNPKDVAARGPFADWLEEHGRTYEATLQRGKAGISEVYYKLRRKSDGLFSEGTSYRRAKWSEKGKLWRKLGDLRSHLQGTVSRRKYGDTTPVSDLEIVLVEVRITVAAVLPFSVAPETGLSYRSVVTISEPLGNQES